MEKREFKPETLLKLFIIALISVPLLSVNLFAQVPAKPKSTDQKEGEAMTQMLELSRPGAQHAELGKLAGTWNFQDARLSFVKGTLTRKPIYNGRFYLVEVTGGKLKVPVADGEMKEEFYQSMQIEGYDNPRMKFVTTSINNHIGSDVQLQTGTYDPLKNQYTYYWESELIKGVKQQDKRILKIIDATHYTETYYEQKDGKDIKVRELNYTKTGD